MLYSTMREKLGESSNPNKSCFQVRTEKFNLLPFVAVLDSGYCETVKIEDGSHVKAF